MLSSVRSLALAALAVALSAAPASAAPPAPGGYQEDDYLGFRNVIPPGQNGFANSYDIGQYATDGTRPPNSNNQLPLYDDLVFEVPGLTELGVDTFLQGRELRRAARAGGRDLHARLHRHQRALRKLRALRRRDDRARLGIRRATRLRRRPRRADVRHRLRDRRGPAVRDGRPAPRRARRALLVPGRVERRHRPLDLAQRPVHGRGPPAPVRPRRRPLWRRWRAGPGGRGQLRRRRQPVHRRGARGPARERSRLDAARRVRARRPSGRPGPLAGDRHRLHRIPRRRDLRQGRRRRDQVRARPGGGEREVRRRRP